MDTINTFSKFIAACMAFLLLICAVACSNGGPGGETSGGEVTVPDSGRASNVQAKDYDGYTFIFSDTELHLNKYDHKFPEIEADPTSDEAVEVAVYRRNDYLRSKYNVEIVSDTELNINNILAAGDDVFDASCNGPYETKSAVQNGYYLDLREFDNVFNFKEDWWWDDSNSEIAYNGRYFQVTGDANIRSLGSVNVTFFNKVVLEDFAGNADLYGLVDSGEWTFDKMLEIARPVGLDLNGDSVYDETDRYGFANNNFGVIAYFYSQGCRFITKDDDGEVVFSYGDKKQVEVLTKIVEVLNDTRYTLYGEKYKNLMDNGRVLVGQAAFAEDRALFTTDLMSRGLLMRAIEQDYGILPMPKYDINQKEYIQYLHGNSSFMSVPYTCSDTDRSARILEDMTFFSTNTVRDAYTEILVKEKMARDDNSKRMVDIIYSSVTFDMGYFGIGSMDADLRGMADNNDTNFTSFFASKAKLWERTLSNYLKAFEN